MKIGMKESLHGTEMAVVVLKDVPEALKDRLTVKQGLGEGEFLCSRPFEFDQGLAYTDEHALNLPKLVARWKELYGEDFANKVKVIEP